MGQAFRGVPEDPGVAREGRGAAAPPPGEPFAIGAFLARQRELRGITLAELAGDTRIPLRSLERLEAGAFDDVHDGFVRGFVRTVATSLGLDPDETVARMLAEPAGGGRGPLRLPARTPELLLLSAGALLLLLLGWWAFGGDDPPPAPGVAEEGAIVLRRDPVRSLAAEHGMLPERLGPERPPALEEP